MATVLSTLHHDKSVMENHPKKLPDMDTTRIDQLVETYACKRQTNRWPVAIFANIVDISALIAFVLWTEINPSWNAAKTYKRRLFLENLGLDLVHGEIERRKTLPRTQPSADIVRNMQKNLCTHNIVQRLRFRKPIVWSIQIKKNVSNVFKYIYI